ncbi:F-box domain protein [Trichostrongylus colubriformis]|uniref:F-box domain protein n=1 Tax=Trichostrongylus colubriformis TaxID=6319 RepID=A0AAN8FZJ8_TRICO
MVIDFDDLPAEMVLAIVSRLSYGDMCNCLMLNRKTRSIINANLHRVSRMWITNISLEREGTSRFKLSVSRNSFKSPKKNWSCIFNETSSDAKRTRCDITDFYNNEGFCGLKWDKANKSTEFDVPSISTALEEHLIFVLLKANVLCFKLVDLDDSDMEVITRVLRRSKSKVSHLQLVVNRTMPQEVVSVIDATGAETIDIVMRDSHFFQNHPFRSHVFRKAWSVTVRSPNEDGDDLLDISDDDLLSLDADSIELFGVTNITVEGTRKLINQWLCGGRKISLVYYRHSEEYDATELLRGIPHKGEVLPIVVTRADTEEELKLTWDSSKFRCFTDEADMEGDDEFPDLL